jgi:pyruvate dehydrogenase E1 component alpha subunit
MTRVPKIEQFAGNAREPVAVPLANAADEGITQVLDRHGELIGSDPGVDDAIAKKMYETMVMVRAIDERGWQLQRSGRLEFWIPSRGQEAAHVGSTAALDDGDWIFLADREPGSFLWRGATLTQMFAQFFGRVNEPLKGRRLPLLLGDRSLRVVPCTTQVGAYIPHAAGAAWAAKLMGDPTRFIVYFGDGATSRGEFHSAMNFGGIHKPPVVFFCQNNGWAVSTPNDRQTATRTFAEKGAAYAVTSERVDGNDALAVYEVTKRALERSADGPTFVEAVTYRVGFHTSSDNPDLYRRTEEVAAWEEWDPLARLGGYLRSRDLLTDADQTALVERCRTEIEHAIRTATAYEVAKPESQFDDVFDEMTWMLADQRERLLDDLEWSNK